jgi:hypothetical protein
MSSQTATRIFGFGQRGGGYDRNIYSLEETREKIEYLHNNPVARGLCDLPQTWKWSSAKEYLGVGVGPVTVEMPEL